LGAGDAFGGFFELGQHQSGANAADMFVSDAALRVDEKTFGYAPSAVVDADLAGLVAAVGIADVEFLQEGFGVVVKILQRDAKKDHVLVFDLLPGGFEVSGFSAAGLAPGCPKV